LDPITASFVKARRLSAAAPASRRVADRLGGELRGNGTAIENRANSGSVY
jgi:hypothetical protein